MGELQSVKLSDDSRFALINHRQGVCENPSRYYPSHSLIGRHAVGSGGSSAVSTVLWKTEGIMCSS